MGKVTVTRPDKKIKDFRSSGTGGQLLRNPYYERVEGPVKMVPLATGTAITKDYGSYEMIYSRANGFGKYSKGAKARVEPSRDDILIFRRDMNRAAYDGDSEVHAFLNDNVHLKIESWQL